MVSGWSDMTVERLNTYVCVRCGSRNSRPVCETGFAHTALRKELVIKVRK